VKRTCRKSAADLRSTFLRSSQCTALISWCSKSAHSLADSPYSYLQTYNNAQHRLSNTSYRPVTLQYNYWLQEAILFTLGVAEGFFGYNSPNLNGYGQNLEYKCGTTVRTRIKISGKSSSGVPPNSTKTCFFHHQYNADFRTLILHRFRPCLK